MTRRKTMIVCALAVVLIAAGCSKTAGDGTNEPTSSRLQARFEPVTLPLPPRRIPWSLGCCRSLRP